MHNPFKKQKDTGQKQAEILEAIKKASANGQCIIISESPEGTRVMVLGRPLVERQVEEILKKNE